MDGRKDETMEGSENGRKDGRKDGRKGEGEKEGKNVQRTLLYVKLLMVVMVF